MPTPYANTIATKIMDIVDDHIEIPKDGRDVKMHEQLAGFIDGENLAQADSKVNPADAYSIKIADIKTYISDGIATLLSGI